MDQLLGDPKKALKKLNWVPRTTLEELITEMIESDKKEAKKESLLNESGFTVVRSTE